MTTEWWIKQSVLILVPVSSYDLKPLGATSYGIIYRLFNMRETYQRINNQIFYGTQKFKSEI